MRFGIDTTATKFFLALLAALIIFSSTVSGRQTAAGICLSDADVKQMLARLDEAPAQSPPPLDETLRAELLRMRAESVQNLQKTTALNEKSGLRGDKNSESKNAVQSEANLTTRFCEILKRNGWPTEALAGRDGAAAAFHLLKNNLPFAQQAALLPVIAAAVNKKVIERGDEYASFLDRLRLRAGLKQLFGTQAKIEDGFLVLYPLQSEKQVDEWRAQYKMPPLAEYLRFLEIRHRMPLIKSPLAPSDAFITPSVTKTAAAADSRADEKNAALMAGSGAALDPNSKNGAAEIEEVIRVDTNEVNLNVVVTSSSSSSSAAADRKTSVGSLEKSDFRILEDGREQEISFFAETEAPFDLVLLIDLSGSTADKINLIRKTARSFIEAKRPNDRLGIVTFSHDVNVVAPLTDDRERLLASAKEIKGRGSSHVWDALQFTLGDFFSREKTPPQRRRAVVFMTDGADNALMFYPRVGSRTLFADLLENVRRGDTTVVPIYLDTEGDDDFSKRIYADARRTLALLAEASGGLFYKARKVEDLDGVYRQVLGDLGRIYTVGYAPTNERRDGAWRALKVEIRNRPDLKIHHKSGYYAK